CSRRVRAVPTSSAPISREYPATSAASTAANLRSTRPPVTRLAHSDPKLHDQTIGVAFLLEHLERDLSGGQLSPWVVFDRVGGSRPSFDVCLLPQKRERRLTVRPTARKFREADPRHAQALIPLAAGQG